MKYKDIILEGLLSTPKTKRTRDPLLAEILAEANAAGDSLFGVTAKKGNGGFPSGSIVPSGGLYGPGKGN